MLCVSTIVLSNIYRLDLQRRVPTQMDYLRSCTEMVLSSPLAAACSFFFSFVARRSRRRFRVRISWLKCELSGRPST